MPMLPVYLGIYIIFLIFIWGFFFLARHHAYTFKRFSNNIGKVTNILMIFIALLSLIGAVTVFFLPFGDSDIGSSYQRIEIDKSEPTPPSYY